MSLFRRAPLFVRLLGAGALAFAGLALAQPPAGVPAAAPAASGASAAKVAAPKGSSARPVVRQASRPLWRDLTPAQQASLAPLAGPWDTLSEAQRRKWIAMASNFPQMKPDEQAKLHSRMTEWVNLSAQQRTQARLNFGATKKILLDDRKAKWEAYQQLPAEEKKRLAAVVPKSPPSTAAALRPVPAEKLATVPRGRITPQDTRVPRIAAAPHQIDPNTLLPQHVQPPAPPAPVAN